MQRQADITITKRDVKKQLETRFRIGNLLGQMAYNLTVKVEMLLKPTCTNSWKLLTEIFDEKTYLYLLASKLLLYEQKRCGKGSRGTKDHLVIDQAAVFNLEICQNGSCVPNDILNWVISKMVWVKLWYWNFEQLTSSWSFFLQSSDLFYHFVYLFRKSLQRARGVFISNGIYSCTKTVTCHSNSLVCIAVSYFCRQSAPHSLLAG